MSNKLTKSTELVVKVRCVCWAQCKWEDLRKVKRMARAMDHGCGRCGGPVEFVSAVRRERSVSLGKSLKALARGAQ